MTPYEEILAAKEVLDLPDRATIREIKASYRRLLKRWHPDTCPGNQARCAEMTAKIIAAQATLLAYCTNYRYSFAEDEVKRHLAGNSWWRERFGNEPLWSNSPHKR